MQESSSVENLSTLAKSEHPDDRECAAREAQQHPFNESIQSILLHLIGDSDWRVRHAAIESICSAKTMEIVPQIFAALYDETNAGKRNAALDILSRFGRHILPFTSGHLNTANSDVRMFLITLLGSLRDRTHLDFIASALQDPEDNVVSAAIVALGSIGDDSFTPRLIEFLHSQNIWFQFQAIEAAGEMQDESLLPHLIPLLESPYCRKAAIKAIGNFQYPDAYRALAEYLIRKGKVDWEAANALIQLFDAPRPEAVRRKDQEEIRIEYRKAIGNPEKEILRAELQNEDSSIRFSAAHLLALDSDRDGLQVLLEFQADPQFAEIATQALKFVGYEETTSKSPSSASTDDLSLLQIIKDEDAAVRRKAAKRMASEIREEYREPLMAALADEVPRVREAAAESLRFYPSAQVTEALLSTLGDEDGWVRAAIYRSLPLEKIDTLFERLPKENPIGQASILRALTAANPDKVVPVLRTYLNHESAEIRAAVCESFAMFPSEEIILLLQDRCHRDVAWTVRISALQVLTKLQPSNLPSLLQERLRLETDPIVKKEILSALQHVYDDSFPEIVFDLLKDPELADEAYAYLRSQVSRKDFILKKARSCRPSVRRIVQKSLD